MNHSPTFAFVFSLCFSVFVLPSPLFSLHTFSLRAKAHSCLLTTIYVWAPLGEFWPFSAFALDMVQSFTYNSKPLVMETKIIQAVLLCLDGGVCSRETVCPLLDGRWSTAPALGAVQIARLSFEWGGADRAETAVEISPFRPAPRS